MIAGIGSDIVDIKRIDRLVESYGHRFLERVFTDIEVGYALASRNRASERLAGRFAVKESVMKVLGTGKSDGVLWKNIETVRGLKGKPEIMLYGRAKEIAHSLGIKRVHVTITHDKGLAMSFVIAEGG